MFRLKWNLLHLCLPTLWAYKLMLIHEHKGQMVADAYMAKLNMVGVMDLHSTSAVLTGEIVSVEIQITMKAVSFPACTGRLFSCPIIYEISKIVGEQKHVWKIST